MATRRRKLINDQEATYLNLLIVGDDPTASKNALQRLCKLYRDGYRLRSENQFRLILLASLKHKDAKVIRWSLNGLAFLGREEDATTLVETVDRNRADPDVLGAGVAALAARTELDQLRSLLAGIDLPLRGAALFAAAQQIPSLTPDLRSERVSIDTPDHGMLRLATVLVGINKAPEHLFDADHENRVLLGQLNEHDDAMTAQYSIWALTEREEYGLDDLTIPLSNFPHLRDNIRAYAFQLIAEDPEIAEKEFDLLREGAEDDVNEVREHLARGLRDTYFSGLGTFAIDWFLTEDDDKTKRRLLDHLAAHSDSDPTYKQFCLELYKTSGSQSLERVQLEASSSKSLAFEIRKHNYQQDAIRFEGGVNVTNVNFNKEVNAGALAINGNATVHGDVNISVQEACAKAVELLEAVRTATEKSDEPVPLDIKATLDEGKSAPTKSNVSKVYEWLKTGAKVGGTVLSAIGLAPDVITGFETILPYLPG